jgi:hypothetical protein
VAHPVYVWGAIPTSYLLIAGGLTFIAGVSLLVGVTTIISPKAVVNAIQKLNEEQSKELLEVPLHILLCPGLV